MTTDPPLPSTDMAVNRPVPCISGGPGSSRAGGCLGGAESGGPTSAGSPSPG